MCIRDRGRADGNWKLRSHETVKGICLAAKYVLKQILINAHSWGQAIDTDIEHSELKRICLAAKHLLKQILIYQCPFLDTGHRH